MTTRTAPAPAPEVRQAGQEETSPLALGPGRAIGTIAALFLRRTVRDRVALFFIVALPVVIILIIGSTFGSMESFDVGVLDRDGSEASADLVATLDRSDAIGVERFDSLDELRREVRTGTLSAGLVVPGGYGAGLGRGDGATVGLIADPTSASAAAVQAAVRAGVGDAGVQIAAARTAAEATGADEATAAEQTRRLAEGTPRAGVRTEPVDDGNDATLGSFDYTAPSNLVLFTFVNTIVVGSFLARDRKQGITLRMLATPHGTGTILAGIGASVLAFSLLQSALILGIGGLVFGVGWGDPLGVVPLVVLFAVVSTAVGLLVGSIVSDPEQAQAAGVPIAIALGMLGGCMWPLEIVPPVMRMIGHVAPQAWAMDGWIALIFDREGVGGIAVELAVLSTFAVVLGLLARRRLRKALTA